MSKGVTSSFVQKGIVHTKEKVTFSIGKELQGEVRYLVNVVRVKTDKKGTWDIPYNNVLGIKMQESPTLDRY